MSRWNDLAKWVGTDQHGGDLAVHRGLVVHIAEGTYAGTIAWQQGNNNVSSHFIVGRAGECSQMVDTDRRAWTQRDGNGSWLSVECAGFTKASPHYRAGWERLTREQITRIAQLLAKAHQQYGVPLVVTSDPDGRGLGHHSMGGDAWGHRACPGAPIIGQKSLIVAAAAAIVGKPAGPPAGGGLDVADLPIVQQGKTGRTAAGVQALANAYPGSGPDVTVDGVYGAASAAKVRRVQAAAKLPADGIVGRKTWGALLGVAA